MLCVGRSLHVLVPGTIFCVRYVRDILALALWCREIYAAGNVRYSTVLSYEYRTVFCLADGLSHWRRPARRVCPSLTLDARFCTQDLYSSILVRTTVTFLHDRPEFQVLRTWVVLPPYCTTNIFFVLK